MSLASLSTELQAKKNRWWNCIINKKWKEAESIAYDIESIGTRIRVETHIEVEKETNSEDYQDRRY